MLKVNIAMSTNGFILNNWDFNQNCINIQVFFFLSQRIRDLYLEFVFSSQLYLLPLNTINLTELSFCRHSIIGLREHIKKRPPLATSEKVQQLVRVSHIIFQS